jgi:hypothetical protein
MIETQDISMKAKPVARIIPIAIFRITTYRMTHICCMDSYLVFPPCFQTELNQ